MAQKLWTDVENSKGPVYKSCTKEISDKLIDEDPMKSITIHRSKRKKRFKDISPRLSQNWLSYSWRKRLNQKCSIEHAFEEKRVFSNQIITNMVIGNCKECCNIGKMEELVAKCKKQIIPAVKGEDKTMHFPSYIFNPYFVMHEIRLWKYMKKFLQLVDSISIQPPKKPLQQVVFPRMRKKQWKMEQTSFTVKQTMLSSWLSWEFCTICYWNKQVSVWNRLCCQVG